MSEYISREAALMAIMQNGTDAGTVGVIMNLPAADVAPVVHGEWIKRDGYTECSACEYWYDSPDSEEPGDRSNFCPNCGAKMGGKHG